MDFSELDVYHTPVNKFLAIGSCSDNFSFLKKLKSQIHKIHNPFSHETDVSGCQECIIRKEPADA